MGGLAAGVVVGGLSLRGPRALQFLLQLNTTHTTLRERMLMPYSASGGVSTSSMAHSMSSLKSQFMETDAWSSFLSEGLYDEDSSGSGDFSPSQTLPDSASDGESNTRKIRRKHLVHKVRLSRNIDNIF